jgi:undecaprenyl-diphosphatase
LSTNSKHSFEFLSVSLMLGLGAAIGALVLFAWLTDEVLEGETRHFDDVTRAAVHQFASPALTSLMRGISFLGSTLFLTLATIVVVLWFLYRKWRREAKLFAITMIGASLLNTTLKVAFKRPRPVPFFNLLAPESYSFPSGHSLASCCFFGALAALLTARLEDSKLRAAIWVVSTLLFLLIGLSRIYLGVHYTTDVIAGFVAALIWIMVVRFVEMQLARRRNKAGASG